MHYLEHRYPEPSLISSEPKAMATCCRLGGEFYQMLDPPDSLSRLRRRLKAWETVYNTIRPHQALGQRTPCEFYQQWLAAQAERG